MSFALCVCKSSIKTRNRARASYVRWIKINVARDITRHCDHNVKGVTIGMGQNRNVLNQAEGIELVSKPQKRIIANTISSTRTLKFPRITVERYVEIN